MAKKPVNETRIKCLTKVKEQGESYFPGDIITVSVERADSLVRSHSARILKPANAEQNGDGEDGNDGGE